MCVGYVCTCVCVVCVYVFVCVCMCVCVACQSGKPVKRLNSEMCVCVCVRVCVSGVSWRACNDVLVHWCIGACHLSEALPHSDRLEIAHHVLLSALQAKPMFGEHAEPAQANGPAYEHPLRPISPRSNYFTENQMKVGCHASLPLSSFLLSSFLSLRLCLPLPLHCTQDIMAWREREVT